MSNRTEAIESEIKKSKEGGTSFYYVDRNKLDRLGIPVYKLSPGDHFIRIIPPKDDKVFYGKEIHIHRKVGANGATFLCLAKMFDKSCPVCELIKKLKEQDPDDERISALASGRRYLFLVYDVENADSEAKGLHWLDAPCVVKDNIVGLSKDKRTKKTVDVSDPNEGRDIEFVRKGSGITTTKYESFKLTDNNPIPEDWLKDVPEFDDILLIPSYEQVKKQLTGMTVESKVDEQELETRTRTSRASNGGENPKETSEETSDNVQNDQENQPEVRKRATRTSRSESVGNENTVKERLDEIKRRRTRGAE